jgi:1-acyl-sn-glycerol-3-phosphate acyltransferase
MKSILKEGISIVVFPEGTFNTTGKSLKDFYDGAFRVAIDAQMPIKPFLLLDMFDRLNYKSVFSLTPGKSRAIFLEEIPVEGLVQTDLPLLRQKVYDMMDKRLREYKASWIKASPQTP